MATPRRTSPTKNPGNKVVAMTTAPTHPHEAVAKRAYEIFLARDGQHGRDLEDWLLAERHVTEGTAS